MSNISFISTYDKHNALTEIRKVGKKNASEKDETLKGAAMVSKIWKRSKIDKHE